MSIRGVPYDYRPSLDDLRYKVGHLFTEVSGDGGPSSQRGAVIEVLDRIVASGGVMTLAAASLAVDLRCTIAVNGWPWERISWSALILDLGEGLVLANDCGGE